ncbi:MAG TPA: YbaK/EbsC family protein [Candidatus Binatia bacterium]|jgi:prolyl-tRNA editing enzyme YbaK/EbsC (Cys-tRNA(Pro) deacylase)|nr:YbaK/EbsC family protein [Candidatus Binatia bacterium]
MPKNKNNLLLPKVREALELCDITYGVIECESDFADTAEFCKHYGFKPSSCANTIIVASKNGYPKFAACVILATTKLDVNKKVCELMDVKRASFARTDQVLELTGMKIGGVTIFGLPEKLPIYVDTSVMTQSEVIMGSGNRTSKIKLDPREILKLPNVYLQDNLAHAK